MILSLLTGRGLHNKSESYILFTDTKLSRYLLILSYEAHARVR